MHCIKCDNLSHIDHRLKSGRAVYKCLKCGAEFNEMTNTFLSGAQISTERIIFIKQLLEAGYSKTLIAQLAAVSRQTVYHYIDRFRPSWIDLHPELCKRRIQSDPQNPEADAELSRRKIIARPFIRSHTEDSSEGEKH
jgi:transposase-like protein